MDMGPGIFRIVVMLVGTILATSLVGHPRMSAAVPDINIKINKEL